MVHALVITSRHVATKSLVAALVIVSFVGVGVVASPLSASAPAEAASDYAVTAATTFRVPIGTQITFSHGSGHCAKNFHAGSITAHAARFQAAFHAFVAEVNGACATVRHKVTLQLELRDMGHTRVTTLQFTEQGPRDYQASCTGSADVTCQGQPGIRPAVVELTISGYPGASGGFQ